MAATQRERISLRRLVHAVVILLVAGLLSFPATCAHAAGPHSVFQDPRVEIVVATPGVESHQHHHHAAPLDLAAIAREACASPERFSDFPDTMAMMAATAAIAAADLIVAPALPAAPRILPPISQRPGAVTVVPDAPPPR